MPSPSRATHNLMEWVKHDPKAARRAGYNIPQKVANEFVLADAGRKLSNLPRHVKKGKGQR